MSSLETPFRFLMRVRYGECDPQQIVFNARYGDYIDIGVTEFMRHLWGGVQGLLERGLDVMVVRQTKSWTSSARFDDVLEQRIHTVRLGTSSFTIQSDIRLWPGGRAVMQAETVYVLVGAVSHVKQELTAELRDLLHRGLPGLVVNHSGVEL